MVAVRAACRSRLHAGTRRFLHSHHLQAVSASPWRWSVSTIFKTRAPAYAQPRALVGERSGVHGIFAIVRVAGSTFMLLDRSSDALLQSRADRRVLWQHCSGSRYPRVHHLRPALGMCRHRHDIHTGVRYSVTRRWCWRWRDRVLVSAVGHHMLLGCRSLTDLFSPPRA